MRNGIAPCQSPLATDPQSGARVAMRVCAPLFLEVRQKARVAGMYSARIRNIVCIHPAFFLDEPLLYSRRVTGST
ncbi:hypothetical protein DTO027B5_6224 [Paecilomyces variotii]|nr:hypothetical protein DTO212C5_7223 [Paecilomyces variotii]KAJ9322243.1 hypothetical protein DTO027B3_6680 [Paecilomyces variotii]KAJ9331945.1 hypothetical protein DTO027B5_6224 [Paecilomyces variotii]